MRVSLNKIVIKFLQGSAVTQAVLGGLIYSLLLQKFYSLCRQKY